MIHLYVSSIKVPDEDSTAVAVAREFSTAIHIAQMALSERMTERNEPADFISKTLSEHTSPCGRYRIECEVARWFDPKAPKSVSQ